MSLYAFILSMMAIDVNALPEHFFPRPPRGWIAGVLFAVGGVLILAWSGQIGNPRMKGVGPALGNTTPTSSRR